MRIRKGRAPLPLSSLSPVPLPSDPYSTSSSLGLSPLPQVQLLLRPPAAPHDGGTISQPFDRTPIDGPNAADRRPTESAAIEGEEEKLIISGNDSISSSVSNPPKIGGSTQVVFRPSHQGKNASTLLKRRRNRYDEEEEEDEEEEIKNVDGTAENKLKSNRSVTSSSAVKKRGTRGGGAGAVLEGSRCSRVNGRGWRCCQPTLVGYSLCEHHLGKGRLRSMMNVRGRRQTKPPTSAPLVLGSSSRATKDEPKEGDEEEDVINGIDEEEVATKPAGGAAKLGAVKARSMSSLLGQYSNRNPNSSGATPTPTPTTIVIAMEATGSRAADVKEHRSPI